MSLACFFFLFSSLRASASAPEPSTEESSLLVVLGSLSYSSLAESASNASGLKSESSEDMESSLSPSSAASFLTFSRWWSTLRSSKLRPPLPPPLLPLPIT